MSQAAAWRLLQRMEEDIMLHSMQYPAPGQFDFSQQRRTFRLEMLRSVPQGVIFTVFATFSIYVAIREFDLSPWMKGAILSSSSVGLLLSLFVVQLIRRIGWSVNRMAAALWSIASLGFLLAAFAGDSGLLYFGGVCFAMMALGSGLPIMSQIYRKHYADESRGRLFSRSSLSRSLVAAAAGWAFGMWLEVGGSYRLLFIVYAFGCLWMSGCVLAMAPVLLRASNRIQWFDAFRHAGEDRAFRKLLGVWMILGLGNLTAAALFVEFIGNPKYGFCLAADQSGLITSTIPMVAAMVAVLPWGWIFDRLPFYQVRAVVNLFFIVGILLYFLGGSVFWLCAGIAMHGIARSGGEILWSLWTTRFAEGERVAEYQSVHSFLTGVRGVVAPLIAFTVVGAMGAVSVAWISAGLMGLSTLMILPEMLNEWRARRSGDSSTELNP